MKTDKRQISEKKNCGSLMIYHEAKGEQRLYIPLWLYIPGST